VTRLAVMEAVGGIFRGFAVALVEGSGKLPRKEPALPTRTTRLDSLTVERIALAILRDAGFVSVRAERAVFDDGLTIWAQHRCGAWARAKVSDHLLMLAGRHPAPMLTVITSMGCYCVRRRRGS
jgi:hypothetical protein